MSKLNYCSNGNPVTLQVLKYQKSHDPDDYLPIQYYYDDYKEQWFNQLEDYLDYDSFVSEFDFKLSRAVDMFSDTQSKELAEQHKWSDLGRFNRWFFRILSNWKSNVKTSSFRLKKRSPVQCPVCGRYVGRIDADHLEHYRAISDLPKYFVYKNTIYETSAVPRVNAVTWGEKTPAKWKSLQRSQTKEYIADKKRIDWPWKNPDGSRGVMCPYTHKIIPRITEEYIRSLSNKYSRYAEPISWESFIETYPTALIQSDTYSLEHVVFDDHDTQGYCKERISTKQSQSGLDFKGICSGKVPMQFEFAFRMIDDLIDQESDRYILKLIASGYTIEDIADTLEMDRRDIRRRMRNIRDTHKDMESLLVQ